jgi:hypothetical protein
MQFQMLALLLALGIPTVAQSASPQAGSGAANSNSHAATNGGVPSAPPQTPPEGVQTSWDIQQMLTALDAQNQKLKPLIDNMHPQEWLANGAPPTYASQYLETRSRLEDVMRAVKSLSQKTDSLSAALDTYFRMEALGIVGRSLVECIQKYGERKTAEQLSALLAQNYTSQQRFREYLRDLSAEREQEFKVADEEAQRCRGMISKEPPLENDTRRNRKK